MKTESITEFKKRGGAVKVLPTRKARGLSVKEPKGQRHMNTKTTSHVWWSDKETENVGTTIDGK